MGTVLRVRCEYHFTCVKPNANQRWKKTIVHRGTDTSPPLQNLASCKFIFLPEIMEVMSLPVNPSFLCVKWVYIGVHCLHGLVNILEQTTNNFLEYIQTGTEGLFTKFSKGFFFYYYYYYP